MTDKKSVEVVYPEYSRILRTTILNSGEVFYSGKVVEKRIDTKTRVFITKTYTVVEDNRLLQCTREEVKDLVIKYIKGLKKDFLQEVHSSEEEFF